MGGDRELIMFAGLCAFALIFNSQDIRAAAIGLVIWFASLFSCRRMAKSDPLMRQVYFRSLKYKKYYPARATPFRINTDSQGKQYK